jgi:hypothetical protein
LNANEAVAIVGQNRNGFVTEILPMMAVKCRGESVKNAEKLRTEPQMKTQDVFLIDKQLE